MILKQIGTGWVVSGNEAILSIPSVVIEPERNYLLNPEHPDFRRIEIGSPQRFDFDPRMFQDLSVRFQTISRTLLG
jgi:RES domain-containing protein